MAQERTSQCNLGRCEKVNLFAAKLTVLSTLCISGICTWRYCVIQCSATSANGNMCSAAARGSRPNSCAMVARRRFKKSRSVSKVSVPFTCIIRN